MNLKLQTGGMTFLEPAPPIPSHRTRLADLLDAELDYAVDARGGFVNHLPMTLVAAAGLGATDAQLIHIYEVETTEDFLRSRPRPAYLEPLTREIEQRGTRAVLLERIPPLLAAIDARWFHAVIRLEHALEARHPAQVAQALGDWAEVARPLPDLPTARGTESLVAIARRHPEGLSRQAVLRHRLRTAASHPDFPAALGQARLGAHALEDAAELALHAHIAAHNFVTLHLVTGACAAWALADHLPQELRQVLGERIAQAVLAGVLSDGSGRLPARLALEELRSRELPDWSELAAEAFASGDVHMIKLTYACLRLERRIGDPLYRWLAARDLKVVTDYVAGRSSERA